MKLLASITLASLVTSTSLLAAPTIYIAAGSANKVLAIDPISLTVTKTFSGIENPHALTATPDGEYVIAGSLTEKKVTRDGETKTEATISVIHPVHGHVMSTMAAPGMIHHQTVTPNGRYVISTHPGLASISYADLTGEGGVKTVETGNGPNYTVVRTDGSKAYVSNSGSNNISEIDLNTWKVSRTLAAGPSPEHLALSQDQKTLYAINARAGKISKIDISSGEVQESWGLGKGAHGLDLSEDGKTLFATAKGAGILLAINLATGERKEMKLDPDPYHLEVLPGTNKVYVSSSSAPKVWVVDPVAWNVTGEIAIEGEGHQMVMLE